MFIHTKDQVINLIHVISINLFEHEGDGGYIVFHLINHQSITLDYDLKSEMKTAFNNIKEITQHYANK
jgi:CRISPR/Cas system-associated exonuclease Cas4 (RecB family)